MNLEKTKELFPYFAYSYSREKQPEKYGSVSSYDEWSNLIQDDVEFLDEVVEAASGLTDSDWFDVEQSYSEANSNVGTIKEAKYGAKLDKLKKLRKGKKMSKCSCGCDLTLAKAKGGKVHGISCPCCKK